MLEKFRHYRERIKEGMLRDMWRPPQAENPAGRILFQ